MNRLEKKILDVIQVGLPVERRPFARVGERLGTGEAEVVEAVAGLRQAGVMRRLGVVFEGAALGYHSTLAAAAVPQEMLARFVAAVNALPGVSHNYGRRHRYNVWFTLTAANGQEVGQTLGRLATEHGVISLLNLPAVKRYKMRVDFDLDRADGRVRSEENGKSAPRNNGLVKRDFTPGQVRLIEALQEDLPVRAAPFDKAAARAGVEVEQVLAQIRQWQEEGVIRRVGAAVRHQQVGAAANALVVFAVGDERVDAAGAQVARCGHVSHCYRRETGPEWPYTLYAMVHGQTEEQVAAVAGELADGVRPVQYKALFTEREYKKQQVRYQL